MESYSIRRRKRSKVLIRGMIQMNPEIVMLSKEPGTEGHTPFHDSTRMTCPEQATPWQQKVGARLPRDESAGEPEGRWEGGNG